MPDERRHGGENGGPAHDTGASRPVRDVADATAPGLDPTLLETPEHRTQEHPTDERETQLTPTGLGAASEPLVFALHGATDGQRFELRTGSMLVLGRALNSDLPVVHPTISRRHAELIGGDDGIEIRDLGSSNGTFVNGARIAQASARDGDTVSFGTVAFVVRAITRQAREAVRASTPRQVGGYTVRHERRLEALDPLDALAAARPAGGDATMAVRGQLPAPPVGRMALKLSLLLEVSKALSGTLDLNLLLQRIVDFAFQLLEVDRASLLVQEGDTLVPRVSREARRAGDATPAGPVPRSIAERAVEERVAILTDDAPSDARFTGQSVVVQQVQSAMCVPLLGHEATVLGVLYVDNRSITHLFDEADLDFLVAFAGLAAVAIENTRFAERLQREAVVRSSFERYFTPQLAARIAADPHAVRLGGERRRVAVLFADIRGFTARAESLPPEEVAALLNEYFTAMVECVFHHGGTLDKFIGDALMAQWGAPIARRDDADAAFQAALDMQASLDELNEEWVARGWPPLGMGVGISVGEAFAGNIGSERRLEYTVIGDTVNVASRLCGHAEAGEILLTEAARSALSEPRAFDPGEPLTLKGKREPVPVYRARR